MRLSLCCERTTRTTTTLTHNILLFFHYRPRSGIKKNVFFSMHEQRCIFFVGIYAVVEKEIASAMPSYTHAQCSTFNNQMCAYVFGGSGSLYHSILGKRAMCA